MQAKWLYKINYAVTCTKIFIPKHNYSTKINHNQRKKRIMPYKSTITSKKPIIMLIKSTTTLRKKTITSRKRTIIPMKFNQILEKYAEMHTKTFHLLSVQCIHSTFKMVTEFTEAQHTT